jgi:lipoyl-dependent peroxiredoxin
MSALYTAHATAIAGRAGRAFSSDGVLDLNLSIPKEMGGGGGAGTNPEQIFAAGYAACFHSALLFIAGQKKQDTGDSKVEAAVGIGPREGGPGFALEAALTVHLPKLSQAEAEALAAQAHEVCPYSNALRGNVPVALHVKGG